MKRTKSKKTSTKSDPHVSPKQLLRKTSLFEGKGWILREENSTRPSSSHEVVGDQALLAYVYKKQASFFFCPSFMAIDSKPKSQQDLMNDISVKGVWKVVRALSEVAFDWVFGHQRGYESVEGA